MYLKTAYIEHIVLLLGRGATSMYLKSASFEAIGLNSMSGITRKGNMTAG